MLLQKLSQNRNKWVTYCAKATRWDGQTFCLKLLDVWLFLTSIVHRQVYREENLGRFHLKLDPYLDNIPNKVLFRVVATAMLPVCVLTPRSKQSVRTRGSPGGQGELLCPFFPVENFPFRVSITFQYCIVLHRSFSLTILRTRGDARRGLSPRDPEWQLC